MQEKKKARSKKAKKAAPKRKRSPTKKKAAAKASASSKSRSKVSSSVKESARIIANAIHNSIEQLARIIAAQFDKNHQRVEQLYAELSEQYGISRVFVDYCLRVHDGTLDPGVLAVGDPWKQQLLSVVSVRRQREVLKNGVGGRSVAAVSVEDLRVYLSSEHEERTPKEGKKEVRPRPAPVSKEQLDSAKALQPYAGGVLYGSSLLSWDQFKERLKKIKRSKNTPDDVKRMISITGRAGL